MARCPKLDFENHGGISMIDDKFICTLTGTKMDVDNNRVNSVAYGGFIGDNEVAIYVDEYGSGDNYCGTRTIYLQESGNGYVVSGLSWNTSNKGYPEYDYTPPGYDPV